MTYIVNQSFFVNPELEISNLSNPAILEKLNFFIAKYEPACLSLILGYPLYKVFGTESSARMTALLDGQEYTDGQGDLQKWQGIKHDTVISLIANYIYFYYEKARAQLTIQSGTQIATPEKGMAISPRDKMANAWNFFSSEVEDMCCFLWLKKDNTGARVYPEFSYHQYLETRENTRRMDSIFEF